jgi:hypothetical protein
MFFACQFDEMLGIDSRLVSYSLNVKPGTIPVVQPMRTFHTEVEAQTSNKITVCILCQSCT